ncbi:MAG: DedA family protein [Bryobacteraceae bacterium]
MDFSFVLDWVTQYGYIALFAALMLGIVGLPIPDETLLVFTGYLLSKGKFNIAIMWLTAWTGSMCGITLSYWIGRTLGMGFVHKWGKYLRITPERLDKVHKWYDRMGHWVLVIGYYIAGVRHFSAIVAGTSGLTYPHFALYAYLGGLLWVSTFLSLGYFLGDNWEAVAHLAHEYLLYASIVLIAGAACYYLFRWWRRRSATAA